MDDLNAFPQGICSKYLFGSCPEEFSPGTVSASVLLMLHGIFLFEPGRILVLRVPSGNAQISTTRRIRFPVRRDVKCALTFGDPLSLCVPGQPQQLCLQCPWPLCLTVMAPRFRAPQLQSPQAVVVAGLLCHCSEIRSEGEQVWADGKQLPYSSVTPALTWVMWGKTEHRGRIEGPSAQSKCINQGLQLNLQPGFMQVLL